LLDFALIIGRLKKSLPNKLEEQYSAPAIDLTISLSPNCGEQNNQEMSDDLISEGKWLISIQVIHEAYLEIVSLIEHSEYHIRFFE
jgi:hypothetical protein